ncbi:MAG: lipoyl(octanoyl) transferase LipB [candidate division Zixibacteria bacterium]|nr:lipoyl(octanoyl) transferase LipB [candidate division Zixibacteria bacterium]
MSATATPVAAGEARITSAGMSDLSHSAAPGLGWTIDLGRRDYEKALQWQRSLIGLRRRGLIRDLLIYVEHPPCLTLGKQTRAENLREVDESIPRFEIERGGDVTYHGPGQLVCYPIFDLNRRGRDLHKFIRNLEQGIIDALGAYEIAAKRVTDFTGVWVDTRHGGRKIASIGIAAQKWVSFHGVAVNLTTDLAEFSRINPCGLESQVMTSLQELTGRRVTHTEFAAALTAAYAALFDTLFTPVSLSEIAEDIESDEGGGHV